MCGDPGTFVDASCLPPPLLIHPPCVVIVLQEVQQANILPAKCLILIVVFIIIDTVHTHLFFIIFNYNRFKITNLLL